MPMSCFIAPFHQQGNADPEQNPTEYVGVKTMGGRRHPKQAGQPVGKGEQQHPQQQVDHRVDGEQCDVSHGITSKAGLTPCFQ